MSDELKEGVKQSLRLALISAVPLIIEQLRTGVLDWKIIITASAIALLGGLDKWLHESDKGITKHKGLVPF